jgi:hypothetical protein
LKSAIGPNGPDAIDPSSPRADQQQLARQRQTKFEKIVADFGSNKELMSQKRSNRGREGRYGAEL